MPKQRGSWAYILRAAALTSSGQLIGVYILRAAIVTALFEHNEGMAGRPECAVPLRNFLGTSQGLGVAQACSRIRTAWVLGACTVLAVGLAAAHVVTARWRRRQDEEATPATGSSGVFVVPLWLAALPLVYAAYTAASAAGAAEAAWRTEELHFATSDMPKKEYLEYRALDDRLKVSTATSLAGTGLIGTTALFGPFLRADR